MKSLGRELQKDMLRGSFARYTKRAFEMLPRLDHPSILDIGCGSGVPTIELARLSNGQIFALDISQPSLDELQSKIRYGSLSARIQTVKGTLLEIEFPDETFDILWSEGSIQFIGFEHGLKKWRRILRPGGFLVVHDEIGNLALKLSQIPQCGYSLLGHFTISEEIWWREYYEPLEQRIQQLRQQHRYDTDLLNSLSKEQREVDMFKKEPSKFASVFLVMQKTSLTKETQQRKNQVFTQEPKTQNHLFLAMISKFSTFLSSMSFNERILMCLIIFPLPSRSPLSSSDNPSRQSPRLT